MKKATSILCVEHAKQYPKSILHTDNGVLFCTCCNLQCVITVTKNTDSQSFNERLISDY